MAISKAKKVVELTKGDRKILVTIFEGGQVSSCIEDEAKTSCETCQCDDETCQEWVNHLKSQGYESTEIEMGELELEESLPKFLEQREVPVEPHDSDPLPRVTVEQEEHTGEVEVQPGAEETPAPGEE